MLAISAAAELCGARGHKPISAWAKDLGQEARARFRCRYRNGRYVVPSRTRIRDVLTRVYPESLDRALQDWNALYAASDEDWHMDSPVRWTDTLVSAVKSLPQAFRFAPILSRVGNRAQEKQLCSTRSPNSP